MRRLRVARYFVFNQAGRWLVALEGRPLARHADRNSAIHSAIIMADLRGAMHYDTDVVVEADGRLDIVWMFGANALPAPMEAAA